MSQFSDNAMQGMGPAAQDRFVNNLFKHEAAVKAEEAKAEEAWKKLPLPLRLRLQWKQKTTGDKVLYVLCFPMLLYGYLGTCGWCCHANCACSCDQAVCWEGGHPKVHPGPPRSSPVMYD